MADDSSEDQGVVWPVEDAPSGDTRPPSTGPRRAHAKPKPRWGRIAIVTIAVIFAVVAGAVAYFGIRLNASVSNIAREDALCQSTHSLDLDAVLFVCSGVGIHPAMGGQCGK